MKTAIYLRQSLDRDQNELAIDRQREDCLALAAKRGWTDTVEYVDNDTSASVGKRPAYRQLLADIDSGAINAVVCWHLDRLHRQPMELEQFIDLADRRHVALATVTGDVDLSTDQGRLVARITGAVARAEVERKRARQVRANRQRAARGLGWPVAGRAFGYTEDDEIIPEEAAHLRKAHAAIVAGDSLYGIAKRWNEAGIKTAKGGTWAGNTVGQVLRNPRHAGLRAYNGEILEGVVPEWPPIITRDVWEATMAVLGDPKRLAGNRRSRVHLLTGLAECGHCGKRVGSGSATRKNGTRRITYQCKHCLKIVRDQVRVDAIVTAAIAGRLARPDAAQVLAPPTVDIEPLREQANALRAQIVAAEAEYDDGVIDGRRLQARKERVNEKLAVVEAKMLSANSSRVLDGLVGAPDADVRFAALPLDRQRAVVDTLATVRLLPNERPGHFDPETVDIQWKSETGT